MTTTDPKLIERIARALCLALGRRGDTEAVERSRVEADWPRYVQHAHHAYPVIAAAINEAAQKERAVLAERERCIAACEAQRMSEPQCSGDAAYDHAINHCINALRAIGDTHDD